MRKPITRRHFLQASCAAMGSTTLFSSLGTLALTGSAAAQSLPGDDYRALVCVLLAGGNDSFNMLVPTDPAAYADYAAIRADLALARETLLPLSWEQDGRRWGLHPAMPELQSLFDQGRAAVVANVGTLAEPVDLAGVTSGSARVPLGLYSHADQIDQWQTSLPDRRGATGWAGRAADLLQDANPDQRVSMNISLGGGNVFQAGERAVDYSVTTEGAPVIEPCEGDDPFARICQTAVDGLNGLTYRNLLEQAYADGYGGARATNAAFNEALGAGTPLASPFGTNPLSSQLEMVARIISVREALGHRRQTFFVIVGGWDHHDEVLSAQATMLPWISQGLAEFHAATEELGVAEQVTSFTISDFGRTLTSNGQGSDHGWGGNQIVLGGSVNGGRFYGEYPALYAGNPLDTGRGRLIPTLATDVLFAELALWFGVAPGDLGTVLPNLGRFIDPAASPSPLGMLDA